MKESFIFYRSFGDALIHLDKETQNAFFWAIFNYCTEGKHPNFKGIELALWEQIKFQLDKATQRYETAQENGRKGAEFGKLGGRPRKTPPPPDDTPQDRQEEEIITAEEVTPKNTPKRFVKPTLKELRDYIFEEGINAEAEAIFDYYEANGWNVGKNKMKDWRACVRNWARRQSEFVSKQTRHRDTGVHFSATSGDDYEDWFTVDKPEEPQTQTLMEAIMQGKSV